MKFLPALLCLAFLGIVFSDVVRFGMPIEKNTQLGDVDQSLVDGFNLWKYWVETYEGGLRLGGENVTIELITETIADGIPNSTPNSEREPLTRNATRRLLTENQIDVIIGPFGTARTQWVMEEKYSIVGPSIPFLMAGAGGDVLFQLNHSNVWAVSAPQVYQVQSIIEIAIQASQYYDGKTKQDIAVIAKQDGAVYEPKFYITEAALANYTDEANVVFAELYPSTLQTADLAAARALMGPLSESNARAVLSTGGTTEDVKVLLSLFDSYDFKPSFFGVMNAADALNPNDSITPEFVSFVTFYHPDLGRGVPNKYMGISSRYPSLYTEYFGRDFTDPRPPQASASFVGWQLGAERSGANWRNYTTFIDAMLSLKTTDPTTETFLGRWEYIPDGHNIGIPSSFVQLIKRDGQLVPVLLKSAADLVYPAPWPWTGEDSSSDDGLDTATTIGIVVGCIAGFFLLLIILAIIFAVIFLVVKRQFFHLILLPKGEQPLDKKGIGEEL